MQWNVVPGVGRGMHVSHRRVKGAPVCCWRPAFGQSRSASRWRPVCTVVALLSRMLLLYGMSKSLGGGPGLRRRWWVVGVTRRNVLGTQT